MDYSQAIDYILSFADFERSGRFQERPDVAPMLSLLRSLGDPHLALPGPTGRPALGPGRQGRLTVHIGGSKGKGSVAAMLEAVLRAAGLSTGLYTSPHLHSYCERIRLNGEPIAEERFARLTHEIRPAVEAERRALGGRQLVTFDLLTALAFLAFREEEVEAQVLEVGLGGRVDSTNVFETKEVCAITPISLEHTAILGDTVELIAGEKAAIIRPGSTVVLSPQAHQEAVHVVREAAAEAGAPLLEVARRYRWRRLSHDRRGQAFRLEGPRGILQLWLPLLGEHQMENAVTAVACADALADRGYTVPDDAVVRGLASVSWPGRLEVLCESPLVVADGAHNRDSARRFREALSEYFSCCRAFLIVGTSADKDVTGLAEELAPLAAGVIATAAQHPRAMPPQRIAAAFESLGVKGEVVETVSDALKQAMADVGGQGVICLLGSLFVVAEGRQHFLGVAAER